MNITRRLRLWYKQVLQQQRDIYYDTHEPYKNRKERKIIAKYRKLRSKR